MDATFLGSTPQNSESNIIFCFVANGRISENRIREMFDQRVFKLKDFRDHLVYKKLSQYPVRFLGFAFLKTDKSFNLHNHVREYDYDNVISPKPATEELLKEVLPDLLTKSWELNQSHWEVLNVHPFKSTGAASQKNVSENQSLVIIRFEHSLMDGLSAIELFRVLFKSPFSMPGPVRNAVKLSEMQKIKLWCLIPYELAKTLPFLLRRRFLGKGDPSKSWFYSVSKSIPVSTIKTIKEKFSVNFASILRSCINGGICQVLDEQGQLPPEHIDALSTLGTPDHPGGTTNHMRLVMDVVPLKSLSSLDRLLATDSILKESECQGSTLSTLYLFRLISMFPLAICRSICLTLYILGPSYFLSILPSTTSQDFIDEAEIVDVYVQLSLNSPIGMGIAVWGLNNKQRINILQTPNLFSSDKPITSLTASIVQKLEELGKLN
ncbi:unnamed protein product [Allacma fusca]|uniref:Diacylglycerol O-acyltransferase n=1 Tax=Allacma fusca TaxID=39272 RepID=A0A8J2NZ57_9HEXA|nr:unnamed protein product [Allacma fusca]